MKTGIDYIGVSAGAMIINDQGQVLLCKRSMQASNEKGMWENPGGKVFFGETLEDAMRREIKEELNIDVDIISQLIADDHIISDEKQHWVATTFIVKPKTGQTPRIMEPKKCDEIKWFSKNELPQNLSLITKHDFEKYFNSPSLEQIAKEWTNHPTGKIPTGEFCSHCGRYNARNSTATMLALNSQNQVLLIKRKREPEAGWWAMPGGYLDWNETLADCAIRELNEETGLEAKAVKLLGVYDALNRDKDGRQNIDHCYVGSIIYPQAMVLDKQEVIEAQWFSLDQLPNHIAFDHRQMIEDYYGRSSNR